MNRAPLFLIFCIATFSSGCIFDDGKNTDHQSAVQNYMPNPLVGNSVTWRMITTDIPGGSTETREYTQRISAAGADDGHNIYRFSTDTADIPQARFYIDEDALWFYIDIDYFDGLILGSTQQTMLNYYHPLFDFSAKRGIKHTILENGTTTDELYVNFNIYSTLISDYETVSVPMGSYEDCHRFELKYEVIYTPKIQGDTHRYDRIETHWFAKKTGQVKRVIEYYSDNVLYRRVEVEAIGN